jgi:sigma-B regulation protein RsbU (phosphoserine phosphatase)
MFVTISSVVLDTKTGEAVIADAGHGPPILISADGTGERPATKTNLFMGAMKGVTYGVSTLRMQPGDRLLLYTDGVNEADNPEGCFFGNDGLLASIKAHAGGGDLKSLLTDIREDIRVFAGAAPQSDDITMLIVHYKP